LRYSEVMAYYDSCGGSEALVDHLRGVGDILLESVNSPIRRVLERRYGLERDFINLLALAGYLHDIGKAIVRRVYASGGCVRYSFRGHEAVSAFVVAAVVNEGGFDEIAGRAAVFAVLYHHHAMGTKARIEDLKRIEPQVRSAEELADIVAEAVKPLPRELRSAAVSATQGAAEKVLRSTADITGYVLNQLDNDLWLAAAGVRGGFGIYSVSVAALVAADYVTAASARGTPSSSFARSALEFARHYLGVSWLDNGVRP